MTWFGAPLDPDQRDLVLMLDALASDRDVVLEDDARETAVALITALGELGVWTIGTTEVSGGGGADHAMTTVALERLGRYWPALGWASTQAHAAVDVLAGVPGFEDLVARLHTGAAAVAVVEGASTHVRLVWNGDDLHGTVDRVDPASPAPYLLVLGDDDTACLVTPSGFAAQPLRRTGLGGALTRSLSVEAGVDTVHRMSEVDVRSARVRLRVGAAAVACGIAGAAMTDALNYSAGRRQFGDALTALPTVRQSLLDQASRTAASLRAAQASTSDEVQAWAVLREACDGAVEVAAGALQSHGGYGYLTEYPAERRLRDAISLRAAADVPGGAVEAARTLVDLPAKAGIARSAS